MLTSFLGKASSASTETFVPEISTNPPVTIYSIKSLPALTDSKPGRSVVNSGACSAIAVRSPSEPGICISDTSKDANFFSGETKSNCMVAMLMTLSIMQLQLTFFLPWQLHLQCHQPYRKQLQVSDHNPQQQQL